MDKDLSIKILNEVLNHLGMNPKQLSEDIGKERPQWIYDVLNPSKKVGISKKIAGLIKEKHPEISLSYLLTGEGELLMQKEPEIEVKDGKIKVDFKKLWEAQEKKGVGKEWMKLYLEAPKTRKGMIERIRVAVPEAKSVRPSMAFQHLLNTNPTLALWAATGKDDKVVVSRSNYETVLAKLATLERLAEIQSKELKELKGEANIEPISKLF